MEQAAPYRRRAVGWTGDRRLRQHAFVHYRVVRERSLHEREDSQLRQHQLHGQLVDARPEPVDSQWSIREWPTLDIERGLRFVLNAATASPAAATSSASREPHLCTLCGYEFDAG